MRKSRYYKADLNEAIRLVHEYNKLDLTTRAISLLLKEKGIKRSYTWVAWVLKGKVQELSTGE